MIIEIDQNQKKSDSPKKEDKKEKKSMEIEVSKEE